MLVFSEKERKLIILSNLIKSVKFVCALKKFERQLNWHTKFSVVCVLKLLLYILPTSSSKQREYAVRDCSETDKKKEKKTKTNCKVFYRKCRQREDIQRNFE